MRYLRQRHNEVKEKTMKSIQELLAASVMDFLTHESTEFSIVDLNGEPVDRRQEKVMYLALLEMIEDRLSNLPKFLADPDLQQFTNVEEN